MLCDDTSQPENDQLLTSIEKFARDTKNIHLKQLVETAKTKVTTAHVKLRSFLISEQKATNDISTKHLREKQSSAKLSSLPNVSKHLYSHDYAWRKARNIPSNGSNYHITVVMKAVDRPGDYHSWIPVKRNHTVNTIDEPYVHYFGDTDADVDRATRLYKAMREDYNSTSAERLLSDGETDESGFFCSSTGKNKRIVKEDLYSIRLRSAQRHSVLATVNLYGCNETTFKGIGKGIDVSNLRRIQAIYNVALARKREKDTRDADVDSSRNFAKEISSIISHPKMLQQFHMRITISQRLPKSFKETLQCPETLYNFCLICFEFACGLHDGEIVIPLHPIEDSVKHRIELINAKRAYPCSQKCFLLKSWEQNPLDPEEKTPWTKDELGILKEGLMMFREDSCNLSVLIGTRSCREVCVKLGEKKQLKWSKAAEAFIKGERRRDELTKDSSLLVRNRAAITRNIATVLHNDMNTSGPEAGVRGTRIARKSTIMVNTSTDEQTNNVAYGQREHQRFLPCTHEGYCSTSPLCNCRLNEMHCDSRCACNSGRWKEKDGKLQYEGGECGFRSPGCRCGFGKCNTDSCPCIRDGILCNPSFCKCTSQYLPARAGIRERQCRNCDVIVPRHKKTYIGRSFLHGFGLFAGEVFNEGDIVGVYSGVVMDSSIVEKAIRLGQERNNTYAFDITEDQTCDAAMLGTKIKFVNHCDSPEHGQNCKSTFLRRRGDAIICLRALRRIEPGEEFLFDYKITHAEGNEWLKRSLATPLSSKR